MHIRAKDSSIKSFLLVLSFYWHVNLAPVAFVHGGQSALCNQMVRRCLSKW